MKNKVEFTLLTVSLITVFLCWHYFLPKEIVIDGIASHVSSKSNKIERIHFKGTVLFDTSIISRSKVELALIGKSGSKSISSINATKCVFKQHTAIRYFFNKKSNASIIIWQEKDQRFYHLVYLKFNGNNQRKFFLKINP